MRRPVQLNDDRVTVERLIDRIVEKAGDEIPTDEDTVEFLRGTPDPTDDDVHQWAKLHAYDLNSAESVLYKFATRYAIFMSTGKSSLAGITIKDVDMGELRMGVEVEQEHVDDIEMATKIAMDHLAEFSKYYTGLQQMEKALKQQEAVDAPAAAEKEQQQDGEDEESGEQVDDMEADTPGGGMDNMSASQGPQQSPKRQK